MGLSMARHSRRIRRHYGSRRTMPPKRVYQMRLALDNTPLEDPIEEPMVETAINIVKVATAVGIDLWSPADLRKLLRKARKQLAEILQQVERMATWPSYL
eukprot:5274852-Karenia_brevis.AAC.1